MQAIEVKGQGVRRIDRSGEWLKPAMLVAATLLAIAAVLLASGTVSTSGGSSGATTYSAQRQTQQALHGNLAGDDANAGTPDHSQPTEGFLP